MEEPTGGAECAIRARVLLVVHADAAELGRPRVVVRISDHRTLGAVLHLSGSRRMLRRQEQLELADGLHTGMIPT
jgi:ABC-type phosphonate transport system ATPase subunit